MVAEWTEQNFEENQRQWFGRTNESCRSAAAMPWQHWAAMLVPRRKADILNTNLASSIRLLHLDTAICFSNILYTVCAASHLKSVVVNVASPDVS